MLIDKKGLQRHNRCPCEFRVDFDLKKPPIKPLLEIVGKCDAIREGDAFFSVMLFCFLNSFFDA